jgi:transcriptional regulator with XRE-family HTH domain
MMQTSLAKRLRVLRVERGLTLRQAAEKAGVRAGTLSGIERGDHVARDATLGKIAKAYDVPVEDLLEEPALSAATGKAEAPGAKPGPTLLEDLDTLLLRARELKAEWTRLMDYDRMTRPGEYERVRPRLGEIEHELDELRRRAQDLDAPRHMIMRWPNRPPRVVFFEEPTEGEEAELRAAVGAYEEERVFSHAS